MTSNMGQSVPQPDEEERPWEESGAMPRDCEPHRANLLLRLGRASVIFGVLTFLLCFPGLLGVCLGFTVLVLAQRDLRMMRHGRMDLGGQQNTKKALTLGKIGLYISLIGLAPCAAFFPRVVGSILNEWNHIRLTGHW
jgi:hypothetical protein